MTKFVTMDTSRDKFHDECGVFGFYNNDDFDIAAITHDALYGLQHRGQISAGMTVNDGGSFTTVKELGMISEVFTPQVMKKIPNGRASIGHVRYTASQSLDRAANQPLVLRYMKGSLAIASNGVISNFAEIRKELERGGSIFQSNSNAELMAYVIATNRCVTDSIEQAVLKSMNEMKGSYSTVICAPESLIAFRDIHGFRPLCLGKLKNSYIIASESCAIDTVGGEFVRDIEPGEMIVINDEGIKRYHQNNKSDVTSLCIFEFVYIARPDSEIDGVSVFTARLKAGELLYKEYPLDADMVCGVPDSGLIAAEGYSKASGLPLGMGFMKNKFITKNVGTGMEKKKRLMQTKLRALKSNVSGKRIIVIDDSIVRGMTSKHIVKLLRDAGAKEVHVLISSPPFIDECYFGTDIHDRSTLIANNMTVEEIREEICADSLGYLSIESLHKSVEGTSVSLCDGCFTSKYKAEVPTTFFVDKYANKIRNK